MRIAPALCAAAGQRSPIVGMTYYDPGLAYWLSDALRRRVPLAVANLCTWTAACQQPPNNHATVLGHRVVAGAFWKAPARG